MNEYTALRARIRAEIDEFPIVFAFSEEQLTAGLEKLGATRDEVVAIGAGGFVRKADRAAFDAMWDRQADAMDKAMADDDFMADAIRYELGNHEYCITYDPEPTLSALGLSMSDERVARVFKATAKKYLDEYWAWVEAEEEKERALAANGEG